LVGVVVVFVGVVGFVAGFVVVLLLLLLLLLSLSLLLLLLIRCDTHVQLRIRWT
jgi:hypothetical protein